MGVEVEDRVGGESISVSHLENHTCGSSGKQAGGGDLATVPTSEFQQSPWGKASVT